MKINPIAAAALVPATIAGVGLTAVSLAQAAPIQHAAPEARPAAHLAAQHAARRYAPEWVTVRAGQTLRSIAAAEHVPWQAIYATPPNTRLLRKSTVLTVGERLRIPADPKLRAAQYAAMQRRASLNAAQAAAQQPSTASQAPVSAGESAFEQCVSWRESGNDPTDPDGLFGILPSTWASLGYSGTAGQASVAQQQQAFNRLYAEDGTQPWAPSDGC
jgi:hypothetical protein